MQVTNYFSILTTFFTAKPLASFLFTVFILCKSFLLFLMNTNRKRFSNQIPLFLFMVPLGIYIVTDLAWIFVLYENIFSKILSRLAWFLQPLQFYSLSLFLQSMTNSIYNLSKRNKFILISLFTISILFTLFPFVLKELFLTRQFIQFFITISGIAMLVTTMIIVWVRLHQNKRVPYILKLQLRYFFITLIIFIIPETIFALCNFFPEQQIFIYDSLFLSIMQSAAFTFTLMFYAHKVYQLRFLNVMPLVQSAKQTIDITSELSRAKRALCEIKNFESIIIISTEFLKNSYTIAPQKIVLLIRERADNNNLIAQRIEKFIQQKGEIIKDFFKEDSVLVYDELAFTYFYTQTEEVSQLLEFLRSINASVLVPLVYGNRILGALIILKDENSKLFPMHKQAHIGLYGTYVTYSIVRLESEQLEDVLVDREQHITANYKAYQKIARYQESFSQIMNNDNIKKQGLILFKSAVFTFINNAAEELLQVNPNTHQGHPLTKALKEIVRRVGIYGNPYTMIEKNTLGEDIACYGFPYKLTEVIILVSHADGLQTLKFENIFINPSDIDYFIFLHTTQAGALINAALPAKTTEIQKIKVQLLKIVLSKKAFCIDVHDDDLDMFVRLIHRISLKKTLHTLQLYGQSLHEEICISLFGVQHFDDEEKTIRRGLLQKLDDTGVLYIKNIHFLDLKTQNLLAQFIKSGSFNLFKSEQKIYSNVTIVFSSTENLKVLTEHKLFSDALYSILHDTTITVPSLLSFPFQEIEALAEGLQKQMITVAEYHQFFGFTQQERENLETNRPVSFCNLHERVERFIKQRIKYVPITEEISTRISEKKFADPIFVEAVRLGKQALKDRKIMRELWSKLKSQTKIAELLSVDRSSVHRRCKEFGLISRENNLDETASVSDKNIN